MRAFAPRSVLAFYFSRARWHCSRARVGQPCLACLSFRRQVRVKVDEEWIIEHWNETGIRLDGGNPEVVADGALEGTYLMRSQILYVYFFDFVVDLWLCFRLQTMP